MPVLNFFARSGPKIEKIDSLSPREELTQIAEIVGEHTQP